MTDSQCGTSPDQEVVGPFDRDTGVRACELLIIEPAAGLMRAGDVDARLTRDNGGGAEKTVDIRLDPQGRRSVTVRRERSLKDDADRAREQHERRMPSPDSCDTTLAKDVTLARCPTSRRVEINSGKSSRCLGLRCVGQLVLVRPGTELSIVLRENMKDLSAFEGPRIVEPGDSRSGSCTTIAAAPSLFGLMPPSTESQSPSERSHHGNDRLHFAEGDITSACGQQNGCADHPGEFPSRDLSRHVHIRGHHSTSSLGSLPTWVALPASQPQAADDTP